MVLEVIRLRFKEDLFAQQLLKIYSSLITFFLLFVCLFCFLVALSARNYLLWLWQACKRLGRQIFSYCTPGPTLSMPVVDKHLALTEMICFSFVFPQSLMQTMWKNECSVWDKVHKFIACKSTVTSFFIIFPVPSFSTL